jgi:hypothetical protein
MMNVVCIIRKGEDLSHTLASIKFDQFGEPLGIPYLTCDSWEEGFCRAEQYTYGLFVDSGTVFYDLRGFLESIKNYPHQGLIGHIIDPKNVNDYFYLHPQCFFLDLTLFCVNDFKETFIKKTCVPIRSTKNIHSDYTPLWLKKSSESKSYSLTHFGSNLISKILELEKIVVNFSNALRNKKQFLHNNELKHRWLEYNNSYLDIATKQLWILNNEPIELNFKHNHLITPGSGFFWMLAAQSDQFDEIDIVDISTTQINFIKSLLENWTGTDYGGFVVDFMEKNSVIHYNLDQGITKLERLKFNNRKLLREYINNNCPSINWALVKTKKINLTNENIITFILKQKNNVDFWMSNILEYKFTFLTTSAADIERFNLFVERKN